MKISKKLLQNAGIFPKLRLGIKQSGGGVKSSGSHKVKIIADKIIKKLDQSSGKEIEYVRYLIEENGEQKIYDTKKLDKTGQLSYLVQRFAEVNEGDEVILEMKKQGIKNYIQVIPINNSSNIEIEDDLSNEEQEEIPIINEEGFEVPFN